MNRTIYSVITGTGNYIPTKHIRNEDFLINEFYDADGKKLDKGNQEIIDKFFEITTIAERRYVTIPGSAVSYKRDWSTIFIFCSF